MSEEINVSDLYKLYRTPKNVIKHCRKVAELCEKIANALIEKGETIDKHLLIQAANAHDALRVCDFRDYRRDRYPDVPAEDFQIWEQLREKYGKIGHSKALADILTEMGAPKTGNLVAMHAFIKIDELKTLEEKIIYYADKRVDEDRIVDLKTRLEEGKKRNMREGEDEGLRKKIIDKIFTLEGELEELAGKRIDQI